MSHVVNGIYFSLYLTIKQHSYLAPKCVISRNYLYVLSVVTMLLTTFCKESIENFLSFIKRTVTPGDCINESSKIEIKPPASRFLGYISGGFPATFLGAGPEVVPSGIIHKILRFIVEDRVSIVFSILVGLFTNYVAPTLFCY